MRGSEPEPPQTNRIAKDRFAEIAGSPAGCAPAARPAATEGGKPRQGRKGAAGAAQSVGRRPPPPPGKETGAGPGGGRRGGGGRGGGGGGGGTPPRAGVPGIWLSGQGSGAG